VVADAVVAIGATSRGWGSGKEDWCFKMMRFLFVCVGEARGMRPWLSIEEESWGHENRQPCRREEQVTRQNAAVVLLTSMEAERDSDQRTS